MGLALVEKDEVRSQLSLVVGSKGKLSERFQLAAAILSKSLQGSSVYLSHFVGGKNVVLGQSLCGAAQMTLIHESLQTLAQVRDGGYLKVDVTRAERDMVVGFNIFTQGKAIPAGCFVVVFNACEFVSGNSRRILLEALDFLGEELKNNAFGKR